MGTAASIPANEQVPVPYYYRDVDDDSIDSLVLDDDDQTVKSDNTTGNTRGVAVDERDDDEPPHRIIHKKNAFEEEGGYTSFRRCLPFRDNPSWLSERQAYEKGLIVNHIKKMKDLRNEMAAKRKARQEQRNKKRTRRKRRKSPLLRRGRSNLSTSSSISSISHDIDDDNDKYYQVSASTLLFSFVTCNACGTLEYKWEGRGGHPCSIQRTCSPSNENPILYSQTL